MTQAVAEVRKAHHDELEAPSNPVKVQANKDGAANMIDSAISLVLSV